MLFQWIFPAKVDGISCTHSSWLGVPYQVPNIQHSVDEFGLFLFEKCICSMGHTERPNGWISASLEKNSLKCFAYNKVICQLRRLGGENGQFWHNRVSNA
jgi:hypothetical protein